MHFATLDEPGAAHAEPGTPGEERRLRLELRLLADVGLLGFPNVGKSTLDPGRLGGAAAGRRLSVHDAGAAPRRRARRRERCFVLADVPGLIRGAHRGHGLGTRFLRHLSRTAVLVHLLDVAGLADAIRSPTSTSSTASSRSFDPTLAAKPQIVVAQQARPGRERATDLARTCGALRRRGIELLAISAATGDGRRRAGARIAVRARSQRRAATRTPTILRERIADA